MKNSIALFLFAFFILFIFSCEENIIDEKCDDFSSAYSMIDTDGDGLTDCEENTGIDNPNTENVPEGETDPFVFNTEKYDLVIPEVFGVILPPLIPDDNPMTVQGVELGRKLFYDKILSGDGTQSCSSCHKQENAFTDDSKFSKGIDGLFGDRNSMALFNMAWNIDEKFFWDGRSVGIEAQALEPVENPIEMHNSWDNAVLDLNNHIEYPTLFDHAFGPGEITKELVVNAIAQFERTLVSANSRFDQFVLNKINLTEDELEGFNIFNDEERGDCFHCHGSIDNPVWTDNRFHNNGLDESFVDIGLEKVTENPFDKGKFKTPSLRNLAYTAPYMHDGRFETLDEVIDHYSEGLKYSSTIDASMKNVQNGGVQLSQEDKVKLKAFLLSLSDEEFVTNPAFSDPE